MVSLDKLANAIRFLSIDAVEKAQSGHPGMPLGMADIATVLWKKFLKFNPQNPLWFNRDRFVLSNGHGSMLLYSLLHLTGFKLELEEIKNFRQLHSLTPGHPEVGETPGVETTTGPLGQGLANSIGMAIAEKVLAAKYNKPDISLVDHHTYAFVGDGCLMEGISHEACSLAGTLGLGKLIVFYDDNGISIDGEVKSWFTDDTKMRFNAYNWQVIDNVNGHDYDAIEEAIISAQSEKDKPTLIICKTIIGYQSQNAGKAKTHGAPLGADDIANIRAKLKWPYPEFTIPDEIYAAWNHVEEGRHEERFWLEKLDRYKNLYPDENFEFLRRINGDLPDDFAELSQDFIKSCLNEDKPLATRKASQKCIEFYAKLLPELIGGSADLTGSNNTDWSQTKPLTHENFSGNYIHYGVREFAMAAIMNGLSLHGGFIPYGGTFLVFSDYARNAIRLCALMNKRVIFIFSHDSIGLGEDGPTHQPIEHASMLRMTPNLDVWRPASLAETAVAWSSALQKTEGPSALLLSRQSLPQINSQNSGDISRGAYILKDCQGNIDVIIIATGSEVEIAYKASLEAEKIGINVRVISMPCVEKFLVQDKEYQEQILPKSIRKRIVIEALATAFWYQFVGLDGKVIGIDTYGVSAPAKDAFQHFNLTVENTLEEIKKITQAK